MLTAKRRLINRKTAAEVGQETLFDSDVYLRSEFLHRQVTVTVGNMAAPVDEGYR
jgi:hypothetical protein